MGNHRKTAAGARRKRNASSPKTLGPVFDLERHLPSDWWRSLFNSLYLKTDGDVVENPENTRLETDLVIELLDLVPEDRILDLCCGQGRHSLELSRRGFLNVTGIDRSRYLIAQARKRARTMGLSVTFREGDARKLRVGRDSFDCVIVMGNSFGYFEQQSDDEAVLKNVAQALTPAGAVFLDIVDGAWMSESFEPRSWEWIDENHFVCRERALAKDSRRIITREVITHAEKGVIADQFYAERLYSKEQIAELLEETGFRNPRFHGSLKAESTRGQDLGMMAHRLIVTAQAPRKRAVAKGRKARRVAVLLGDPSLPDRVKLEGKFNEEDLRTIDRMQKALEELTEYEFVYWSDHEALIRKLQADPPSLVLNLCDEGYQNDAFKELHIPALLEMLNIPYTGAGPACLGLCYNKSLVTRIAQSIDVPVPSESYFGADDSVATLPSTFPAILKPNFGDSSLGITQHAVVENAADLLNYIDWLRKTYGPCGILIQEFLPGPEYSVGIVGNPGLTNRTFPVLEVDYSNLDPSLPRILGYESKWDPDSPYWTQINYKEAGIDDETRRYLLDYSNLLFERLECRDYARFDFRTGVDGQIKLLEVNPNPGWCWDGKFNMMAGFEGLRYPDLLRLIINSAEERIALSAADRLESHAKQPPVQDRSLCSEYA